MPSSMIDKSNPSRFFELLTQRLIHGALDAIGSDHYVALLAKQILHLELQLQNSSEELTQKIQFVKPLQPDIQVLPTRLARPTDIVETRSTASIADEIKLNLLEKFLSEQKSQALAQSYLAQLRQHLTVLSEQIQLNKSQLLMGQAGHNMVKSQPHMGQSGRYLDNGDGTVTDVKTGLMWMRFSLGQSWRNGKVYGKAKAVNFVDAIKEKGKDFLGYSDWRLPTIEELKTLVYCSSGKRESFDRIGRGGRCFGNIQIPTIDIQAFPNTPEKWYWSSSVSADDSNYAWYLAFHYGAVNLVYIGNDEGLVRLVRDALPKT